MYKVDFRYAKSPGELLCYQEVLGKMLVNVGGARRTGRRHVHWGR